jgi:hypothetical protein
MSQETLSVSGLLNILDGLDTVVDEATVVVGLDVTIDVKAVLDQSTEVEKFFIIVSLDVLDGLDTVVNEATVVVGLDVTVDVKTVVDQTTEVEEFFIIVLHVLDNLNSFLDNFGVLSNKLKGFLGMLSEGVLVGVDEFFNSLFSLLDGFGVLGNILANLLDTSFNLVDVEEFFVVVGEVLDEFNSLLNDFRVLSNILKSLLGILLKDILVASISVDDLFSLLFNLSDEFRVFNSEFTGFLDSFFNLVEAEEFFVV